jgi:hypothetical protein
MDDQEEQEDAGEGDEEESDEDAWDEVDVTAKAPGLEIVLSKPKSTKSTSYVLPPALNCYLLTADHFNDIQESSGVKETRSYARTTHD